ncbi:MAG: SF1B family DNA helicase RecD2, partial [Bacillota bacterium]
INVKREKIDKEIDEMIIKRQLTVERINDKEAIYLPYLAEAEEYVANKLIHLDRSFYEFPIDLDHELKEVNEKLGIKLHKLQIEAIKESLNNGVLVITGGPGTGKTTIINSIISIFKNNDYKVLLAAPTGKAANRMAETTGEEAKTIHRLLQYQKGKGGFFTFNKDSNDPLVCDCLIIDEVSMIDISLMKHLLDALVEGTRLILVGDADQLPSVGPGNVLRDIINSNIINYVTLDKIFRQSEKSLIVTNAHKINHGDMPVFNKENKDCFFIKRKNQNRILEEIKSLCQDRLKDFLDINPLEDIQILTPMKNHILGTKNINKVLQKTLNPKSKMKNEKKFRDKVFRVGDKVMQIKNNYEIKWENNGSKGKGIFNGDTGIIYGIDKYDKRLLIEFDNKRVKYKYTDLDQLVHSYAITIHKSQGNEFPVVIIPMSWIPNMLANRKILYTALTRAKKLVVFVGQKSYLKKMINNKKNLVRNSGLKERLIKRDELNI